MLLHKPSKENTRAVMLCALYSLILLFFLSPDSYIHDLVGHYDSAWFFTCGKAWMNGMTPYVDFADSKGPLLWLIYGIGYLISHHSYVGVFWMSIVFYTATLFIAYKLCRLYLETRPAAVATALIPFFLFYSTYRFEMQAEDYCNTFLMLALYALCRVLRDWRVLGGRKHFLCAAAMGASCAACVLMKWNIGVGMLAFPAVTLIYAVRGKKALHCITGALSGFAVIALPFVVYMLCCGCLDDMVREYFVNTVATVDDCGDGLSIVNILTGSFVHEKKMFLLLIAGIILFCWKKKWAYLWLIFCLVALKIVTGASLFRPHYALVLMPFAIFLVMFVVGLIPRKFLFVKVIIPIAAVACVCVSYSGELKGNIEQGKRSRQNYYRACYIMAQVERPTILYYSVDTGIGTSVGVLPSCRYWAPQTGITDEMKAERDSVLMNGVADFVVTSTIDEAEKDRKRVEEAGYVEYETITCFIDFASGKLYGRPGLELPPDDFYVSDWDVWLKRNIFGI